MRVRCNGFTVVELALHHALLVVLSGNLSAVARSSGVTATELTLQCAPNPSHAGCLSSHGCHFKTRNGEYKRSCHESSIRIPTAFSGGAFEGGGRLDDSITLLDFAPSLLDACAIPVPDVMQGRSILPLMAPRRHAESAPDWPTEAFVQISEAQIGRAVRTRRWKYGVDAPQSMQEYYLEPIGSSSMQYQEQYLYDLQTVLTINFFVLSNLTHCIEIDISLVDRVASHVTCLGVNA